MITAVQTAQSLDWKGWLRGSIGAFISGGAGTVGAFVGVSFADGQDPDHFIARGHHMLEVMAITFLTSAIISLAKFLQTNPMPDDAPSPAPEAVK